MDTIIVPQQRNIQPCFGKGTKFPHSLQIIPVPSGPNQCNNGLLVDSAHTNLCHISLCIQQKVVPLQQK